MVFDGKIPLKQRQANLGSLNHCHPRLPSQEDDIAAPSSQAPHPTDGASGSSTSEELSEGPEP
jgi:hypothetical protein